MFKKRKEKKTKKKTGSCRNIGRLPAPAGRPALQLSGFLLGGFLLGGGLCV